MPGQTLDIPPGPSLTLVLGGARSGKSRLAESLVTATPAPWRYLATAQAFDDEMVERIAVHRAGRAAGWETDEVPLALAEALSALPPGCPVLVDCLTLWLSNVLLAGHDPEAECGRLADVLARPCGLWVVVANEVGLGIVPDNALARRFRDHAGWLNQRIAATADRVILTAAGLPLRLK
ncbi:MAG: bifunctional adenosylcobinamide kinase/adenosylcobinamide-phosphate guanylyltransferase [Amaricoccus sp.]|uniref:bifunctional adenosylcobinamide kinase/adenosylcobinamide-phosphate guanylyltransferase n=1 Tax=Amaricoccus sp. TaxID=1872485 RepID=UPI0039E34CF8